MMLYKQEEKYVPLSAEQDEWLHDTNEEPDEQELEAHYIYMGKIQEILTAYSVPTYDAEPLEHVQSNDDYNVNVIHNSSDMCDNEEKADQNAEEYEDVRVVLANLIANLKLDTDVNKKIQKQLKKANATLTHELNECKFALEESNDIQDRCRRNQVKFLNDIVYKTNQSVQTIHMLALNPSLSYNGRPSFANPKYLKKAQYEKPCLYKIPYDKDDLANIFALNCDETLILVEESRSKLDKELIKKYD
ncbi:hypothetical protein Tco_1550866 [Tanacetum coccineum]